MKGKIEELEKHVWVRPAFDRRHPDPKKNYGIHGVELCFVLLGPRGAIQFVIMTNWQLPHVDHETFGTVLDPVEHSRVLCKPIAADIGYHSPNPMYDGQASMGSDCPWVEGDCYYDGSSLMADDVYRAMLIDGHVGIWRRLLNDYIDRFTTLNPPDEERDELLGELLGKYLPRWENPHETEANPNE